MVHSCKEPIVTESGSGRDSIIWHAVTNLIMFAFEKFYSKHKGICFSQSETIHAFHLYSVYIYMYIAKAGIINM